MAAKAFLTRKADGSRRRWCKSSRPDSGRALMGTKPRKEDHKMEYHGFRSVSEYERECSRLGFKTRRIPFHKDGGQFFALVTSCPGHPTGTSVESWTLFTADESARVLDGVIGGPDSNWLGRLAAHGYYPDGTRQAPTESAPAPAALGDPSADETGQLCFQF